MGEKIDDKILIDKVDFEKSMQRFVDRIVSTEEKINQLHNQIVNNHNVYVAKIELILTLIQSLREKKQQ